ncbi:MAG: glycosyltransferase family 4 protein [Bacteroidota bacterium]
MKQLLVFSTQLMETGGIESHILEFCDKLSARGVEITLIVPNFQMKPFEESRLKRSCKKLIVNKGKAGLRTMSWLFSKAFLMGFNSYDSLYTNGQGESLKIFATLIRRKKYWVHHHHTAGDLNDQATWGKLYWSTLKQANKVIACSYVNAGSMQTVLHRDINVVPCFSRKIEVEKKDGKINGSVKLGYYGRLIAEKGIDVLCSLSNDADCAGIEFHVWGQGENYPSAYFKKFPALKYHGTFNGTAGLTEVITLLDGFLLISTHPEGLPVCLLEAMGAGLPWLATNKGGITDIAFDPLSTRVIASTLSYEEIKREVILFAEALKSGNVDRSKQIEMYNKKFAASAITTQWEEVLAL